MIKKVKFFQIWISLFVFWYFKNSKIHNRKNIKPIILVLGQIDKERNVGERNIEKEINISKPFSILSNLSLRHL